MPEFTRFLPEKYFSRFFGGWGRQAAPVSYAYAKDLANIFRTLPGPGEFQELAPPLIVSCPSVYVTLIYCVRVGWVNCTDSLKSSLLVDNGNIPKFG